MRARVMRSAPTAGAAPGRALRILLWSCLLVFAAPGAHADQNDPRLDALFSRLHDAEDAEQARGIEQSIWRIWMDSGREDVNALMQQGVQQMTDRDLVEALATFDRVVEMAPKFAEGWNKRATVYYLMDELSASMRDIERTLALEPRHFGAISGMGLIFLERGDEAGALKAFEAVLKIHPHAPGARAQVKRLREQLRDEAV